MPRAARNATGNYGVQLLVTDAGTNDNIIFSNGIGINSAGTVILSPSAAWHLDYGLDVLEGPAGTVIWHNVVEDLTSGVSIDDASGTVVLTNQLLNCVIGSLSLNNSSGSTIEFNTISGPDPFEL
jgi:parallel beta-helix repeat protein